MKYKIGDKVTHFTGINGMIVKASLDSNTYSFVYIDDYNVLHESRIEECEIDGYMEDNNFGFSKNRT